MYLCNAKLIRYDYELLKSYHFYYTKFFIEDQKNNSLVTGPASLLHRYKRLVNIIKEQRQKPRQSYQYRTVNDLVSGLEKNITIIPELEAVKDLLQDYEPHKDTVGDHTRKVVDGMKEQNYYKNASDENKNILLLASYLHDIGKGPKSKWKEGKMTRVYHDHPADAVPMLQRIMTEDLETISDEEIRKICMLVVYHDIVGDCMGKGREKQQIVDVIENEDDLDMLLAISYADAKAVNGAWGLGILGGKEAFKESIMKMRNSL